MYDTIHAYLEQNLANDVHLLSEIPVHLDRLCEHHNEWGLSYSGRLDNLRITVTNKGVSIKGSLAKFYFGSNLKTLSLKQTEAATIELSDRLHLDINKAKVSRIDFGTNLNTKFKPETYFQYLGECQYYNRNSYTSTLYYSNHNREMAFYDKSLEMKHKQEPIPESFKDCNLLRYEIRFKKRLSKFFKVPIVNFGILSSKDFYNKLVNRYLKSFNDINKIPEFIMDYENMKTPKDFESQMYLKLIESLGEVRFNEIIEELRDRSVLDRSEYYSRIKNDVRKKRKKYNKLSSTQSHSLLNELNTKIMAIQE